VDGRRAAARVSAQDGKLIIVESEAETVRFIFRRYAELGSVRLLKDELDTRSKLRTSASGRLRGGKPVPLCPRSEWLRRVASCHSRSGWALPPQLEKQPFAPDEWSTGLQAWIFPIKLAMRLRPGGEQRA
jgi:hypothetical protein